MCVFCSYGTDLINCIIRPTLCRQLCLRLNSQLRHFRFFIWFDFYNLLCDKQTMQKAKQSVIQTILIIFAF